MAKLTVGNGLSEYIAELQRLQNIDDYIEPVIYEGVSVVNKATVQALKDLPTDDTKGRVDRRSGIRSIEKAGLLKAYGISEIQNDNGYINRKIGFANGYIENEATGYKKPVVLVARSIISGTSFMPKNDFMTKASRASKSAAEQAMAKKLDEEINKIID